MTSNDSEHLTTGWEADLDSSDTLLRQFMLSNADRNESMATLVGGRSLRSDAFAAADPASPAMFDNAAVLLQPPAAIDLDEAVTTITSFFPRERPMVFLSAFPTPDLSRFGLELMGHPPLMFRPVGGTPPPPPEGLEIVAVDDRSTLADFVTTLADAYPMPEASGTALADERVLDGAIRFFVGYVDGRPVSTSGAHIGHGINDVEWVSTRREHRGRGIGAALTWSATVADPTLPAVLISSDDGQGVYERMGYVRLLRLTMWHRPAGSR